VWLSDRLPAQCTHAEAHQFCLAHLIRDARLLAGSSHCCTEAILLAHGFTIEMLIVLVRDGFATATPEIVHAGSRPIEVVRVGITDAGRQALDG
jgi:hypothetical protein